MFAATKAAFSTFGDRDPYWDDVTLLIQPASQVGGSITDKSPEAHSVTAFGNAQTSTASPLAGMGSVDFDGTGDYLSASGSALALGTGDLTVECWIYAEAASDTAIFESRSNGSASNGFTLTAFSSSVIRVFSGGALISSSGTTYLNEWTHIAVTRSAGTWQLWIDGVSQGTSATSRDLTNTEAIIGGGRYISTSAVTSFFNGQIADFRITKAARYAAAFTPPTKPHPTQ